MVSAMLEKISGKTYEHLVQSTLNELGFSVRIGWPNSFSSDQPWGHMIADGKITIFQPEHVYKLPYLILPAGDLSMKPLDYARYTQMHLQGLIGKSNYLLSETYNHLHWGYPGFSLGVANGELSGYKFSGFDGSGGTFFCRTIIVPESDFVFSIMMNAGSGTAEMEAVDWLTMKIVKKHFNWWWKFWM
jgi:D-alanyl-D-alanine carboxypeptidase